MLRFGQYLWALQGYFTSDASHNILQEKIKVANTDGNGLD